MRPMSSLLLLIDCYMVHELLNEINYTVRDKYIEVGFSYSEFMAICLTVGLSVRLFVFPKILETLN
jgi:hypothetical protein